MASFFKGVIGGSVIVLMLWVALWAGQLGNEHPNNVWIADAIIYKQSIARALPSPKIIVVSGSGAMFGINSGELENTYLRPAVNLGVNAGISLPAILYSAMPVIEPGDLVLLPLEYPLYNREEPVSSSLVHWANSHPETFLQLQPARAFKVFAQTSFKRIIEGYRGVPDGFSISGDYGPHNLDKRGDQLHTARALREDRHWNFLNSLPVEAYGQALQQGSFDWERLRNFRDKLLDQGACPVFMPPPLLARPYYKDSSVESRFYEGLPDWATSEGLFWIGRPLEAMREIDDFFDTSFHLVDEARSAYTQQIIGWLGNQPMSRCKQFYQEVR